MDTFHPSTKTFIVGFITAFFLTKNGRDLGAEILHQRIKMTILFWLPLRLRCKFVKTILGMPPTRANTIFAQLTKPWGRQKDFVTKIKKQNVEGHWIVPESNKADKKKRVEWVEKSSRDADLVIYYIHGGGFRTGDSTMYMESFIHIIEHIEKTRGMKTRIFSIDYGKIPHVNYARTKEDCLNGYRYLVQELNIDPKKIVFAGDSAGGNLVASCLLTIKDMKLSSLPQPAGNVQISPWIAIHNDVSKQLVTDNTVHYLDCLDPKMLTVHPDNYFLDKGSFTNREEEGVGLGNPNISPLFGSFVGLCPTLVTYGGTEVLQHDVQKLIGYLERDKVKVDVIMRPEAPHIWLISSILSPTHKMWRTDCSRLADWCANCVVQQQKK